MGGLQACGREDPILAWGSQCSMEGGWVSA